MTIQTQSKRIVFLLQDIFEVETDFSEEACYTLHINASLERVMSCFKEYGYILEEIDGIYLAKTR